MIKNKRKQRREAVLQQILSNNTFASPPEIHGQSLREKMEALRQKERQNITKRALLHMYGRHNPVEYKKQYNFNQKWQEQVNSMQNQNYSVLKNQNILTNILFFTIVLFSGIIVWFLSIFRLFKIDKQLIFGFSILGIFIQFLDIVMNYFLFFKKQSIENQKIFDRIIFIFSTGIINISLIVYLIILLIYNSNIEQTASYYYVVDIFFLVIAYKRFSLLYSIVKIKILASQYRNQLQVIQLFNGCLVRIHIFSLMLYIVSSTDSQNNWTKSIQLFNTDWLSKYIYSLYFACTTMFTVGYGDITPKNKLQIISIIFTQVFGVINIGYIISEIGRFLTKINENQQILFKNISQAEKVAQSFKLNEDLTSKVRDVVIKNSLNNHQVNLEEQKSFLFQLTDEIRQDIQSYSQFNVVKTSIFFICNWSKLFQKKVANCLIKSIYMPQQTLLQVPGKEKIYIVANGLIDIYLNNNANSKGRSIHTIGSNPNKQVQSNVYGYSSLISELKIKLKGVAKDFVTCYAISKEDMLKMVIQNQRDFQYYHEIKSRIILSKIKEKWQAPQIFNIRQCYNPMPYVVIKKFKLNNKQQQSRRENCRKKRRTNLIHLKQQKILQSSNEDSFGSSDEEINKRPFSLYIPKYNQILNQQQRSTKYKESTINKQILINPRSYQRKNYKKRANTMLISTKEQFINKKQSMLQHFQGYQNYQNYHKKHNIDNVLLKYYNLKRNPMGSELSTIMINKKINGFETEQIFEKLIKVKHFKSFKAKSYQQK